MSLYNQLFGENEEAMALLGMLELTRNSFQRYRDVYLNKEGTVITVVARIGGKNRKDYKEVFHTMMQHKNYFQSYDDDFDSTYAYFEFEVPEKYKHTCKLMAPTEDRLSVGDMFKKEVEDAKTPGTEAAKRMDYIASQIFKAIENGEHLIGL